MTAAQLQLDVGDRPAARIEHRLLTELDHLHREQPAPADIRNVDAHERLVRGIEMLLDWLSRTDPLPDDPLRWPCCACFADLGQPCDIPGPRTKWTPPGPRFHLCRGPDGRWSEVLGRA